MNKPKLIKWDECEGKTVSGVLEDYHTLVVSFSDGTHCRAEGWQMWDSGGMRVDNDCEDPLGLEELFSAGAIDQEWFDQEKKRLAEAEAVEKLQKQAKDLQKKRELFEKLKLEFGDY